MTSTVRAAGFRTFSKVAAAVLLFALLAGGIEVHSHGFGAGGGLGAPTRFTPAASHPNLPRHVEAGSEAERPACAACLHNLASRAFHLRLAAVVPTEPGGSRLFLQPESLPSDPGALWVGGRSPPVV
jgi:hypothetical protein